MIGTGSHGGLLVMEEVKKEAKRRKVVIELLPTAEAIKVLNTTPKNTNAMLRVTC